MVDGRSLSSASPTRSSLSMFSRLISSSPMYARRTINRRITEACHALDRPRGPLFVSSVSLTPISYVKCQSMIDESYPKGRHNYWKSNLLNGLNDDATANLVEGFQEVTSSYSSVLIAQLGGAVSRVGKDKTSFNHRTAPYDLAIMPMRSDPAESEKHTQWADETWRKMQPFLSEGVYVNNLSSNEGEERVKAAYGDNYERLVALKNKYDPKNMFRFKQNIRPTV